MIGHGFTIGLDGLEFSPHYPYSGCRICGALFQTDYDRDPYKHVTATFPIEAVVEYANELRDNWRTKHSLSHAGWEHKQLADSGRWYTPEAANKLAAFGIISIIDLAIDQEVAAALYESKPIPTDDVEGT